MNEENKSNLKDYYKFVYICSCGNEYGSDEEEKGKHICPYCKAPKVKRIAAGIWECKKCNSKFTGKAYSIKKEIIKEEE